MCSSLSTAHNIFISMKYQGSTEWSESSYWGRTKEHFVKYRVKLPPDDSVAHAWSRKSRGWIQSEAALSDQEEHRNVEKRNKWNVDSLKSSSNSSQCFTGKLAWDHFEVKFTEGYLVNKTFHPCSPSWIWNHPTLSISDYEPRNELPTRSGMGL